MARSVASRPMTWPKPQSQSTTAKASASATTFSSASTFYLVTYNELTKELARDRIEAERVPSPEMSAFLEGFPLRYLRTHSEEEMDRHLELDRRCQHAGFAHQQCARFGVF